MKSGLRQTPGRGLPILDSFTTYENIHSIKNMVEYEPDTMICAGYPEEG